MTTEELLKKIKSKGYWRVEIHPTTFEKLLIPTFSEVRELIQSSIVRWRGWDYPYWNANNTTNMPDWVESFEDWERHIEFWRFYRSGLFVNLFAAYEDHIDVDSILPMSYPPRHPRAGYISFLSTIYKITEIFEFISRLANENILHNSAFVSIGLHNIKDHELTSFTSNRWLDHDFVFMTDDPIVIEKTIFQRELIANPDDHALDYIVEIFERFNWNNPSREIFSEDQKRLRERRLI
ncbi:hypothetical protein ACFLUX_02580 [Chloroflexota bacterium]